jgi:predicted Zn finger-like uncharacterized protein
MLSSLDLGTPADAMLIVCPSCATSYMIDPASVGASGRMVRCARCRTTWFAAVGKPASDVSAFVDSVIAEAEAESNAPGAADNSQSAPPDRSAAETDEFGGDADEPARLPQAAEWPAPEAAAGSPDLVPEAPPEPAPPPTISDAPPLVPPIEHEHMALADTIRAEIESEDIETFAARRKRLQVKRKTKSRSSRWTAIVLVLFAANVAIVGARNEVVRYLPQTASLFAAIGLPVNLRNLTFENVRIAKETQDGATILMIEGKIVSTGNKAVEVPRLRFAARNSAGQEIYSWAAKPERSILGPGESMDFHSQLASPPADANDVMVRFFTPQDAVAGGK